MNALKAALLTLLVLALLVGGWLAVPALAALYSPEQATQFGAVGDMFGPVAALFAGIGSLAVFVVLYFDLQHRRSEYRPFVVVTPQEASVAKARYVDGEFNVSLRCVFAVANATAVPALNLSVGESSLSWDASGARPHTSIRLVDSPLQQSDARDAIVRFDLNGESAKAVIRALQRGEPATLKMTIVYSGLNKTAWRSKADYTVSVATDGERLLLGAVQTVGGAEFIDTSEGVAGTGTVDLAFEAVPGTWSQEQVR